MAMANFYGTLSDDNLHGSRGSDLIWPVTGNDIVYGRRGNDQISDTFVADAPAKSEDNDQYHGGAGKDEIRSLFGHDLLFGGSGNDHFIIQNDASVSASGGSGNDHADVWLSADYDIILRHHNRDGDLNHLVIAIDDQIVDLKKIEHVHLHEL
jgi:Ca2+-binding RTX toxin-like protein